MYKSVCVPAPQVRGLGCCFYKLGITQFWATLLIQIRHLWIQVMQASNKKLHNPELSMYWLHQKWFRFKPPNSGIAHASPFLKETMGRDHFPSVWHKFTPCCILQLFIGLLTGTLFPSTPCFRKFRKWKKKDFFFLDWFSLVLKTI